MNLQIYGWGHFTLQNKQVVVPESHHAGRVISIKGFKFHVATAGGELECELSGKLLFCTDHDQLPVVGDWVMFLDYGDSGYITDVLPRVNVLSRRSPGSVSERQMLAANVDAACIVQGLDSNFNLMRLERYIVQVSACGINPIVVLNKCDLITDRELYTRQVMSLQRDCKIVLCSTATGEGLEALRNLMTPESTFIFVGSSGVGKSSLLNRLLDSDLLKTGAVSATNEKGRHTTTTRDLLVLPNGALVIDTPGMREFGVTDDDHSGNTLFPAIQNLGQRCRYRDCMHLQESGCAVTEGLRSGLISHESYESYVKLIKEQQRFTISADQKKKNNRQHGRMVREVREYRSKYKF